MACEDTGCGIPWEEMRWVLDPEGHGEFVQEEEMNAYIQPAGADSSASATTHAPTKHTSASTAFSSLLTSLPGRLLRRVMGAGDDSASGNARGGKGFQDAWTPYPVRFLLSASLVSLMRGCMGVATQDHVGSTIMVALPMKARHVAPPTGAAVGEDEEGEGEGEEEGEEEEGMEEGMEEAMVWVDMKWATREVVEGKRALVVDGDGVRAEATITALRYLGVQAAVAGTHEEATRKILGRQPEAAWRSGGNPKPRISSSTDVGAQGKPANGSDAAASKSGIGFGRRIKFDHRSLVLFHSASAAARAPVSPPLPASIPLPAGPGCAGVSYARALAAGFADTLPQPCLVADLAQCLHAVSPLIARVTSCALSLAVALPIPSPSCASWLTSPSACMRALAGGGFADTLPQLCLVADLAQCLHALFAPIDQSDNLSDTSTNHVAPADPSAVSSLAPSTPPRPKSPQFRSKAALGLVKPEDAAALLKEMLSGREVMVVDDNAVNRMVARKTLQGLGAKVELVGSGEKALERLSLSSPNAFAMLLIDLHMPPGIDGYETARRIRALFPADTAAPAAATTTATSSTSCSSGGSGGSGSTTVTFSSSTLSSVLKLQSQPSFAFHPGGLPLLNLDAPGEADATAGAAGTATESTAATAAAVAEAPSPAHRQLIFALTADVDTRVRQACKEAGMDGTLSKPIAHQELLSAIKAAGVTLL
ncbi:unnamed protein product [Closterium sp. NIES-65]|nr:unnamed protein product [Closterium sp. NIES-65]